MELKTIFIDKRKDAIIKYVMNQQLHHQKETCREEFIRLLKENNIDFDEKYLIWLFNYGQILRQMHRFPLLVTKSMVLSL